MSLRDRPWPDSRSTLPESVVGFLQFLHTTAVNKLDGLSEERPRASW